MTQRLHSFRWLKGETVPAELPTYPTQIIAGGVIYVLGWSADGRYRQWVEVRMP